MPKLVCIKCQCLFKIEKNGISAVELVRGRPYEMSDADKWKCPVCGMEILAGFGAAPWAQQHQFEQPNIKEYMKRAAERGTLVEYRDRPSKEEREAAEELSKEYGIDFTCEEDK